jgi:hypothetical protein
MAHSTRFGLFCAAGALALVAGPALARAGTPPFEYEAPSHPVGLDCAADAQALAARVASLTGVTIVSASCEFRDADSASLRVVYNAPAALPLETTVDDDDSIGIGMFPTRAACEAAIPAQSATFQQQTGLTPVAAYCYRDKLWSLFEPFVLRIDALGTARVHAQKSTVLWVDVILGDRAAKLAQFESRLATRGVTAAYAAVDDNPGTGMSRISTIYYSNTPILLGSLQYLVYDTVVECLAAADQLDHILATSASPPLVSVCTGDNLSTGGTVQVAFQGNFNGPYQDIDVPQHFARRADCDAALPAIVQSYAQSLGRQPLGAICDLKGAHVFLDR